MRPIPAFILTSLCGVAYGGGTTGDHAAEPLGPPGPRSWEPACLTEPASPAVNAPEKSRAQEAPRDRSVQGLTFVAIDITHLAPRQRIVARGGRTDVAQDFDTALSGLTFTLGRRFGESRTGAHRLGGSVAILFDGVPAFIPQLGDAMAGEWDRWWNGDGKTGSDRNESGNFHNRTESMAIPFTVFYDYEYNFGPTGMRAYAGPTLGVTLHTLGTNFSGNVSDSSDSALHYGFHTGVSIPIGDSDTHLRFEYEWRREQDTSYNSGVDLRIENRTDHLFSVGLTASF